MTAEELRKRTRFFAVNLIRFCRTLPRTDESRLIARQLMAAGTSVGANYRAACRRRSDADFINKLGVVIEEADETAYWMEILVDAEIVTAKRVERLLREADEFVRIFVRSRETARQNARARALAKKKANRQSQIANH